MCRELVTCLWRWRGGRVQKESKLGESERVNKTKATFDHLWTRKEPVYVAVCVTTGELSRFLTKEFESGLVKSAEAPPPLNAKGCCSTGRENKCCTEIFKEKYVFMMLIYKEREQEEADLLSLLLFNRFCELSEVYNH